MASNNDQTMLEKAKELWNQLGNISVNEEEEIEEDFLGFAAGTHREYIWDWFEETYDVSVAKDLMRIA